VPVVAVEAIRGALRGIPATIGVISRVFTDNLASRDAHRAAGFEEVGIPRCYGKLDGQWKDCVLVERLLGPATSSEP
jgi:RimJ/RimL family protein N-acetyltransferase